MSTTSVAALAVAVASVEAGAVCLAAEAASFLDSFSLNISPEENNFYSLYRTPSNFDKSMVVTAAQRAWQLPYHC